MNWFKYFAAIALGVALAGCAGKPITSGRPFDVAKIGGIQKGVTTSGQLIALLGPPFAAASSSAGGTTWTYLWKKGTATTKHGPDGPVVTSQGTKQTLEVRLENGIVVDYTYKDDPFWNEQLETSPPTSGNP